MMALRNRGGITAGKTNSSETFKCAADTVASWALWICTASPEMLLYHGSSSRKAHSSVMLVNHCQNQSRPADSQWRAYRLVKERSHTLSCCSDRGTGRSTNLWREPPRLSLPPTPNSTTSTRSVCTFTSLAIWFASKTEYEMTQDSSRGLEKKEGKRKRWISIIQKAKKKGGFWMSNTNPGREVQDAKKKKRNKQIKTLQVMQNLLEWSPQRLNKHAISALLYVCQSCVAL